MPVGYEELVYSVFGRRCAACGSDYKLQLDHHYPLVDGHALLHNAVLLCSSCNGRKRNKRPEDFYDAWTLADVMVSLLEVRDLFEGGSVVHDHGDVA